VSSAQSLVKDLTDTYAKNGQRGAGGKDGELTVNKGYRINVGMIDGKGAVTGSESEQKSYAVRPVGSSVQEFVGLWRFGGLHSQSIQADL